MIHTPLNSTVVIFRIYSRVLDSCLSLPVCPVNYLYLYYFFTHLFLYVPSVVDVKPYVISISEIVGVLYYYCSLDL